MGKPKLAVVIAVPKEADPIILDEVDQPVLVVDSTR